MTSDPTQRRSKRIAVVGTVAVALYAAILGVDAFEIAPIDAAPSMTFERREAALAATDWAAGRAFGQGVLLLGVLIAVAGLVLTTRRQWPTLAVAAGYLTLLALGWPAGFVAAFSTGMTLADTFGGSGGISPTGEVMRVVALVCAFAAVVVTVVAALSAPHDRAPHSAPGTSDSRR